MADLPASQMPSDFQALFEAIPDPYLALAPNGTVVAFSDAFQSLVAIDRAALINRNFFDVVSTDFAIKSPFIRSLNCQSQSLEASFKVALQNRSPQTVTLPSRWVVTHIPVCDAEDHPVYILYRFQQLADSSSAQLSSETPWGDAVCEQLSEWQPVQNSEEQTKAELQESETWSRHIAERKRTEEKQQLLVQASTILFSSLDYETTLKNLSCLLVPAIADWCVLDIVAPPLDSSGVARRVAVVHTDPAKQELMEQLRQYPLNLQQPGGVAEIIRTGRSLLSPEVSPAQLQAAAQDSTHLQLLQALNPRSGLVVPLIARGQVLGAISLAISDSNRCYRASDLILAEELAHRAAIAVDHARLYQEARRLQQVAERAAIRTSWLQSLTAALSESATLIQVADVIVQHSLSALGAAIACVALLTPDGTKLEIIRKIGEGLGSVPVCEQTAEIQVGQTFSIDAPLLLAEAVRTKQVQGGTSFASHCTSSPQKAETHREIYPAEAYKWIAVPLLIEARAVGGIGLAFATPQVLNQEDQSFIQALALQCAQAIERARLYEVEQQAREVAEAANRLKDEFLAMLSHELRSPLNPILGWVRLLQTRSFDAKTTQYALEAIERNAKLQAQLVEDLLDVSQILRGKLTLNFRLVNLNTTIRAALATVRSDAAAKSIQIHTSLDPTVPPILADASRLQQVVTNLLSNAIKFTPTEGWVEVRLRTAEGKGRWADSHSESSPSSLTAPPSFAEITISDTGQGITPEFLPHVFDSFRQADATTTRKFGGLGLGLAIVRQIVELHGGQVFADSAGEGQGATFTVWLPLRSNSIRT